MAKNKQPEPPSDVIDAEFTSDDQPTLPAVRKPPTLALAPDAPVSDWHHNYDLTTTDGKAGIINASNVPEWQPGDGGTYALDATNYVCYPDDYVDRQTGEIVNCTSLVLVGKDGRHVKFRNDWSLRRLHAMLALYTPAEWAAGIRIECYAAKSRRPSHTYGSFRVVPVSSAKE